VYASVYQDSGSSWLPVEIQVLDVSNPAAPTRVASWAGQGEQHLLGKYAYGCQAEAFSVVQLFE
jgi:hypothetical protein